MKTQKIKYPGYGEFKILIPNNAPDFSAGSFPLKDPATSCWIQNLEKDSLLVHIGANTGIHAIPCALYHVKKVVAIEPNIINYNTLLGNL